jgi:hypothetical protein
MAGIASRWQSNLEEAVHRKGRQAREGKQITRIAIKITKLVIASEFTLALISSVSPNVLGGSNAEYRLNQNRINDSTTGCIKLDNAAPSTIHRNAAISRQFSHSFDFHGRSNLAAISLIYVNDYGLLWPNITGSVIDFLQAAANLG